MKIDVTPVITDLEGKPIEGVTLRKVICDSLLLPLEGDEKLSGEKKAQMYALAVKTHNEDQPDFRAEDIAEIKARIGKRFAPLVVGRAYALLDPPPLQAVVN